MEDKVLQDAAKSFYRKLKGDVKTFDIVTILAIMSLIKALIQLYMYCSKNDWHIFQDSEAISKRSWNPIVYWKRRKLRGLINKHLGSLSEEERTEVLAKLPEWVLDNKPEVSKMFTQIKSQGV